jgi:hypothetical protein
MCVGVWLLQGVYIYIYKCMKQRMMSSLLPLSCIITFVFVSGVYESERGCREPALGRHPVDLHDISFIRKCLTVPHKVIYTPGHQANATSENRVSRSKSLPDPKNSMPQCQQVCKSTMSIVFFIP